MRKLLCKIFGCNYSGDMKHRFCLRCGHSHWSSLLDIKPPPKQEPKLQNVNTTVKCNFFYKYKKINQL
jgi:hypothetical protein